MASEQSLSPRTDEDATEPSHKACEFYLRTDGIYEITFHERSTRAVDQLFDYLAETFSAPPPDVTVRMLVNSAKTGAQPLPYTFRRVREWMLHVKVYPPTRLAFVHEPHPLTNIVDKFLRTLYTRHLTVRSFPVEQYDAAVDWLLEK